MGHESKAGIGYHLPLKCCGKCDHSYRNTYDDACCYLLESYELIDFGGVCDRYVCQTESFEQLEEPIFEDNCENCKYSYSNNSGTPICRVSGCIITDTKSKCAIWEQDNGT